MKLQKMVAIWSGFIAVLSFILSYCFNASSQFISGIFVGLFSSGILICITSIVTYFSEREKELTDLYEGSFEFVNSMLKNTRKGNSIEVHQFKDNLDYMMHTYDEKIFFRVDRLEILNHKSDAYRIVAKIWWAAASLYGAISEDREIASKFILGDISDDEIKSIQWKSYGDESIKKAKELLEAREELGNYLHYHERIEDGKRKRKEALK